MMNVVFITHGGKKIGLGHVVRCISLAHAIRKVKIEHNTTFIVNDEVHDYVKNNGFNVVRKNIEQCDFDFIKNFHPDIIVIDSYNIRKECIDKLRMISPVILFDDNGEHNPISSDFLINGNIHAKKINYISSYKNVVYFLGPKYLVMKPEYWNMNSIKPIDKSCGILITTGGADFHNIMPKFMKYLKELKVPKKVVVGPMYTEKELNEIKNINGGYNILLHPRSLKEHIENARLVITACGTTVYEVLTLKRRVVVYTIAENQRYIAETLRKYGIRYIGYYEHINWHKLKDTIKEEYERTRLSDDYKKLFDMFDGKGVFRLLRGIVKHLRYRN